MSDTPDFTTTFPPHCIAGTKGADFIPETYPKHFEDNYYIINYSDKDLDNGKLDRSRNIIILKDAFDVFAVKGGNPHTETILEELNPKMIIVYGVATNVCVDFAVKGLVKRGYTVKAVVDAIMELPETDLMAIYDKWERIGVKLITMKEVREIVEK